MSKETSPLKSYRWYKIGKVIFFIGIIFFILGFVLAAGINEKFLILIIIGSILFILGIFITLHNGFFGQSVSNWIKLKLGTAEEFPQNEQEKKALIKSGWPEKILFYKAHGANEDFEKRNHENEILKNLELPNNITGPQDLPEIREMLETRIDDATFSLNWKKKLADKSWQTYTSTWDIFKSVGILPKNPKNNKIWDGPNSFRTAVEKTLRDLYDYALSTEEEHKQHLLCYCNALSGLPLPKSNTIDHLKNCEQCQIAIEKYRMFNEFILR